MKTLTPSTIADIARVMALAYAIKSSPLHDDDDALIDLLSLYVEACEACGYVWPEWNEHLHMTCREIVDDTLGCVLSLITY